MEQEIQQFEWGARTAGITLVHPLALVLLAFAILWLLNGRKLHLLVPVILVATLVTSAQRIVIGPADFTMVRLVLLAAVVRVFIRRDTHRFQWGPLDSAFVAFYFVSALAYIALWRNTPAVVYQSGRLYDALLLFFFVRLYVHSVEQFTVIMRTLALVCIVSAIFMMVEHLFHYNVFSIFGGVRAEAWFREGRLRAQGSFGHAILAGTFGAVFLPLFWALWSSGANGNRNLAGLGASGAVIMVLASSSAGPIFSLLASGLGVAMWSLRRYVRLFVRGFVVLLVALHLYMQAPVWHLIGRTDVIAGSSGYHRYSLVNNAINRFSEWALIGTRSTRHWGWMMHDVTNRFVAIGVNGGVLSLFLFILLFRRGFRIIGSCMHTAGSDSERRLFWAWGVVLFAHGVSLFGVSYFGQMTYFWPLTLALIAALPEVQRTRDA